MLLALLLACAGPGPSWSPSTQHATGAAVLVKESFGTERQAIHVAGFVR